MTGARTGWVPALERLGLLKYILATLFTGLAFVLTAGAYYYEELSRRPPRLPAPPAALLAAPAPPQPFALRAPVSRAVRFAAAAVKLAGRPAPHEPDAPAARRLALAGQAQERMP